MTTYFPPYGGSSRDIKAELDLSNYPTKTDLKIVTGVDTSNFATKANLAALKTEIDKIDTDKLKTVPDDLVKLSNVVKNDVVKTTEYNTLKTKVDGIDTSDYVLKSKFEKDVKDLNDKIPDISGLATISGISALLPTSTFNSKVTELENKITGVDNKIPNITNLATKTELTTVKNKIPDVTGLVKKSDYATETTSIKNDYATNASLDSKINDLKAQHIADEVKKNR